MKLLLLLVAVCAVVSSVQYSPEALKDEIKNLPGAPDVSFRMFSGYITVAPTRKLFYWFTESQSETAATDPLMLWTNGGPGCSGLSGFMAENGPFRPLINGSGLKLNPHSWNLVANTIFIEQPAGVGFSTIEDPNYSYSDGAAAADNLAFIRGFLTRYPQYNKNPFYITSESYGGHYMPTLAMELLVNGSDVDSFRGIAVGNPLTWMPYRNYGMFGTWAHHQLLPKPLFDEYKSNGCVPPNVTTASTLYATTPYTPSGACDSIEDAMQNLVGNLNPYALDFPTCLTPEAAGRNERHVFMNTVERTNQNNRKSAKKVGAKSSNGPEKRELIGDYFPDYEPCTDNWAADYLHRADVITAIHAIAPAGGWAECNGPINQGWSQVDVNAPMMPLWQKLATSGKKYNLLIYSGDDDSVCATMGSQQFIWDLGLPITSPWAEWTDDDGQVAGFHVAFEGLHFSTIHGAGHMTPSTRPAQTLVMLKKFLNSTW